MVAMLLVFVTGAGAQSDSLSKALDTAQRTQQASVNSQQDVDKLDDQAQQLNVYAQQLNELLAQQTAQLTSLRQQLADLDRAGQDLMPLMLRMTDSLDKFVSLDLPFLRAERSQRITNINTGAP
jgi:septal ring factor EnvC (AmiA/AmiB activator)